MRAEPIYPNEYYHIYNRGVAKQPIFFRPHHWPYFIQKMKKYFQPEKADIIAYCLMPNHYHLIVFTRTDNFGKDVMMPMMISYSKAVNNDMHRIGPLFQDSFKAKRIETTEQLVHLSRYIHLNPVKAGLVPKPEMWKYSSYQDYIGSRNGKLPNPEIVLSDFFDTQEYTTYVESWQDEKQIQSVLFDE
jgi:REP element-mobilizing transposase RayT